MFIQNIMVAAKARGLDTCPQVVFARHPTLIAEHLDLPPSHDVIFGMSLAYGIASRNRLLLREPRVRGKFSLARARCLRDFGGTVR